MFRKIVAVLTGCALLVVLSPSPAATSPAPDHQRGCCSHHGGVSGSCCGNGNIQVRGRRMLPDVPMLKE